MLGSGGMTEWSMRMAGAGGMTEWMYENAWFWGNDKMDAREHLVLEE